MNIDLYAHPLNPTVRSQISALIIATHYGDHLAANPDTDDPIASNTADVAWLAYQAITALHDIAPDRAQVIAQQLDTMADASEAAYAALARLLPDPACHQPRLDSALRQAGAAA